jgi:hypothetical protein
MTAVATIRQQLRPDCVYNAIAMPSNFGPITDRRMSTANVESGLSATTILLRKLPKNTTPEALRAMLLFAKDLKDTEIVANEYEEDAGFTTAIARFTSINSASEARAMLDGKPNTAGQANMIVNVVSGPALSALGRRNTIDPVAARKVTHSVSPPLINAKASRFNGTFQAMDKFPPSMVNAPEQGPDALHTIFSPHSPNATRKDRRMTGKLMIGEEGGDDETGDLIKDPLAYINDEVPSRQGSLPPTSAFAGLSLNTDVRSTAPVGPRLTSPSSAMAPYSPHNTFSPTMSPRTGYPNAPFLRHNYPPVNPADQNPPCNTLYVGNLPVDTSEDELKALFSKQRGYKRLCFRTKQNGPMCFVEFEDISFATKALNELYGVQLHNSIKGGIRLSFSKNPLGVRAGQPGSNNPSAPMNTINPLSVTSPGASTPGGFSTANGPPPGLSMPSAMNGAPPMAPAGLPGMNAAFMHQAVGMSGSVLPHPRSVQTPPTTGPPNMGPMYPDYMMGR